MLLEIIMESILSMDADTASAVIESMSPDELDIVNGYINSMEDSSSVLESIYDTLYSMNDAELEATLESFTDDELDFIVANESIFGKRNSSVADRRIAKAMRQQNTNPTAKTDSAIDKAAKVSNVLNKDVGVAASNAIFNLKQKIRGVSKAATKTLPANDPVADIRAQREEITNKVREANQRGAELRRTHSY